MSHPTQQEMEESTMDTTKWDESSQLKRKLIFR